MIFLRIKNYIMLILNIVLQIIILINITLIGGILPLIERKYLSLIQRRVGPKFVGYKGRLQFIADALKMFLKGCIYPRNANKVFFFFWPAFFLSIAYLLYVNTVWGQNILYIDIEFNLLFITVVSIGMNSAIFFTGYFSKNKYAAISALRSVSFIICAEILLTVLNLLIIHLLQSFQLAAAESVQEEIYGLFVFFWSISMIVIIVLIEVCKSPFDLTEAETELVTGFHTEYGAFFFALFYLGEYFHIFFTSAFLVILFLN